MLIEVTGSKTLNPESLVLNDGAYLLVVYVLRHDTNGLEREIKKVFSSLGLNYLKIP